MKRLFYLLSLVAFALCSCQDDNDLVDFTDGDIEIHVKRGKEWEHEFSVGAGIHKNNTPQIAIWAEDTVGNYISTVYVTYKAANEGWLMNDGNRRKESLPYWAHKRGVKYPDGLYLPTKDEPLSDGMTGATPLRSFDVCMTPKEMPEVFVMKFEINHSTDFNDAYPKRAKYGEEGYSGGRNGSGQPAVVYSAVVDRKMKGHVFEAELVGHSSADGSDGNLYTDLNGLTTALRIVKHITITIR